MVERYSLPFNVRTSMVVLVFAAAVAVFHYLLIVNTPLSKRGWKIVDYVWLGFGVLGLIGTAGQARQVTAASNLAMLDNTWPYSDTLMTVVTRSSSTSGVCRGWSVPPAMPPSKEYQRMQDEYAAACHWFLDTSLTEFREIGPEAIDPNKLPPEPHVTIPELVRAFKDLRDGLAKHNQTAELRERLKEAAQKSWGEEFMIELSPVLLALALALRITKVTGELI